MPAWMKLTDQLGPEKVLNVYDPVTGMKGVVVVDTTLPFGTSGGVRMLPDITTEDIFSFARATTYKYAALDFPIGGTKAGIRAEPEIRGPQRRELLIAFGNAIKTLLCSGVSLTADMGIDSDDIAVLYEGACATRNSAGLAAQMIEGEPIEDHAIGYGVVVCALASCQAIGMNIKGARVAIEGFGKAGGTTARYISESGAKVVAIATGRGAAYNKDGLDVMTMLQARKTAGDRAVTECRYAKPVKSQDIYNLPVDILIPGAKAYVINKKNAGGIKAKIIASIADVPLTDEAEEILFKKKVLCLPDFISNSGGAILNLVDALGGTADDVFRILRDYLGPLASQILGESKQQSINPRALAIRKATEKLLLARKQPAADIEKITASLKKRLDINQGSGTHPIN